MNKRAKKPLLTIIVLAVVLFMSLCLNIYILSTKSQAGAINNYALNFVQMGAMEHVKDTGVANKLESYLTKESNNSGCRTTNYNDNRGFEWVSQVSSSQTQVKITFGCWIPSAHTFAVYENGEWKGAEVTNQWDLNGNPSCLIADKYNIEKDIAPVCFDTSDNGVAYVVR